MTRQQCRRIAEIDSFDIRRVLTRVESPVHLLGSETTLKEVS